MDLQKLVEPLLSWYRKEHRALPWRENKDPYRIWVSEIMLQQTRVEAVKPYYFRFMERFPNVEELAEVQEEVLLKYWEGLGYYSRARNLKKAATIVMEEYQGKMPDTYENLLKLPGIGSYTAGAIASIAFNRPVPAVDGNVLRILSRVRMDKESISNPKVKKRVEQELSEIMPTDAAGDFNQAMMELGATVCIPNGRAKCEICPWNKMCLAKQYECVGEYPKKDVKKQRTIEKKTVLILKRENKLALHKRSNKGLLAGMYEFPNIEGHLSKEEVLSALKEIGIYAVKIEALEDSKHIFTHKEWHMKGYAIRVDELTEHSFEKTKIFFINVEDTKEEYPIPSAFAAYGKYINITLGSEGLKKDM